VPVNFVMRITEAHADCVAKSAVPIVMNKCRTVYQAVKCELAECNGVLLRGHRIVMPVQK